MFFNIKFELSKRNQNTNKQTFFKHDIQVFGDSEDEDDSSDDGIEYEEYADSGKRII